MWPPRINQTNQQPAVDGDNQSQHPSPNLVVERREEKIWIYLDFDDSDSLFKIMYQPPFYQKDIHNLSVDNEMCKEENTIDITADSMSAKKI